MRNRQVGPSDAADVLADVVRSITYKPGWTFELSEIERGQGCEGLTLLIGFHAADSTNPEQDTTGVHLFPVLPAAYCAEAWQGWILECVQMVERHEVMEWFKVDGVAPFFPDHGPGRNPYALMRIKAQEQAQEAAVPWFGAAASDQHFEGQP